MESRFKVVVVGDGAVGKTTFTNRHISADSEKRSVPTLGADVLAAKFTTNCGQVTFDMWDTGGQEKFAGLRDGYYIGADAAIMMFDVSSRVTYRNVPTWYRDILRICEGIPVVLCGNKVDVEDRQVKPRSITFHRKRNVQYYEISALANYNIEKPFLWLARVLTHKHDLVFQGEHFHPPQISIDEAHIMQLEKDLSAAQALPIGDDDDEL